MDHIAKLIESLVSLLWPILAMLIVVAARPAIAALADSARSRKFTIKIANNELTMEEAHEQDQRVLSDLQLKVATLEGRIGDAADDLDGETRALGAGNAPYVLWVDDEPKNNSILVDMLERRGAHVETARSTSEAMETASRREFALVITDMGASKQGRFARMRESH